MKTRLSAYCASCSASLLVELVAPGESRFLNPEGVELDACSCHALLNCENVLSPAEWESREDARLLSALRDEKAVSSQECEPLTERDDGALYEQQTRHASDSIEDCAPGRVLSSCDDRDSQECESVASPLIRNIENALDSEIAALDALLPGDDQQATLGCAEGGSVAPASPVEALATVYPTIEPSKPLTRQRKAQIALIARGICQSCAKRPLHPASRCHCWTCVLKKRVGARKRAGLEPGWKSGRGRRAVKRDGVTGLPNVYGRLLVQSVSNFRGTCPALSKNVPLLLRRIWGKVDAPS